jgi:hypothetical protein
VDFRVQAFIGYNTRIHEYWTALGEVYHYVFTGETSDWSNTKTLTIPEGQTPTPSPATPTPTAPNMGPTSPPSQEPLSTPEQMEVVIGVAIVVVVISAGLGLLIYLAKRK